MRERPCKLLSTWVTGMSWDGLGWEPPRNSERILDDSLAPTRTVALEQRISTLALPLTLSDRFMRDFSPIVCVSFGVVHDILWVAKTRLRPSVTNL